MNPADIPLLAPIGAERLEQIGQLRKVEAGVLIFTQGAPTTGLWVITRGRVAIERVGIDGTIYATGVWSPGEVIGIAGLWEGTGYPASARALDSPTELFWMGREDVLQLHQAIPAFGLAISQFLARRLRAVQEMVAETRGRPVVRQLAITLRVLSQRLGPEIRLTHEDLSHLLAIQRETVSRALHQLADEGAIALHYGQIEIINPSLLK